MIVMVINNMFLDPKIHKKILMKGLEKGNGRTEKMFRKNTYCF